MIFVVHHHIDHDKCKEINAYRTKEQADIVLKHLDKEETLVLIAVVNSDDPIEMFKFGGLLKGEQIPMQHVLMTIGG